MTASASEWNSGTSSDNRADAVGTPISASSRVPAIVNATRAVTDSWLGDGSDTMIERPGIGAVERRIDRGGIVSSKHGPSQSPRKRSDRVRPINTMKDAMGAPNDNTWIADTSTLPWHRAKRSRMMW